MSMKIKNKGKVHPSPSSNEKEALILSVLSLLPQAILSLLSLLSLEDREVLAYMLTRSLKITSSSSSSSSSSKKKPSKKEKPHSNNNNGVHVHCQSQNKFPIFDCDCFDCYRSFWVRWNSSPNRELIDRAIEAFEDQNTSAERPNNTNKKRNNNNNSKLAHRCRSHNLSEHVAAPLPEGEHELDARNDVVLVAPLEYREKEIDESSVHQNDAVEVAEAVEEDDVAVVSRAMASGSHEHRGLARKVLPDVLGLLNSRLWRLWSPNA